MAPGRKDDSEQGASEAKSKLSHLLETERELEAMIEQARGEAKALVEAARAAAEASVREFELRLDGENRALAERIADDRDRKIDSTRNEARAETNRLDSLDDAKVAELARYIVDRLVGRPDTGGSR